MKRYLTLFLVLSMSAMTFAMDKRLVDINAIKKNPAYLYAEATMADRNEAAGVAIEQLQSEILRWTTDMHVSMDSLTACKISQKADTMMMQRANLFRVFAYIAKKVVSPSSIDDSKVDTTLLNDSIKHILIQRFSVRKDHSVIEKIMHAKSFFELREIMEPMKERGEIIDYGKYATMKNPVESYLIVYDPAGNICAILDKGEETRKNLKTGKTDSIRNYRGCGAIWFIINE